jgi:MinD superfamily P-loop ATPase
MKQVAVLSGKGGTGKTSLVAAFARLSEKTIVLADCDVDAANLALAIPGEETMAEPFVAGQKAVVDEARCVGCAACVDVCRFDAVGLVDDTAVIQTLHCEGCRACSLVCASDAISFVEHTAGQLFVRRTDFGTLVHAALGIAEGNSGKLVASVRETAKRYAVEKASELILIDGPPGIGCPVHATLSGVDLVVAITEPTPSGSSDLERLLDLCDHFAIQAVVIINKYDIYLPITRSIERIALQRGVEPIGRIGFDEAVPKGLFENRTLLDVPSVKDQINALWQRIYCMLFN